LREGELEGVWGAGGRDGQPIRDDRKRWNIRSGVGIANKNSKNDSYR